MYSEFWSERVIEPLTIVPEARFILECCQLFLFNRLNMNCLMVHMSSNSISDEPFRNICISEKELYSSVPYLHI